MRNNDHDGGIHYTYSPRKVCTMQFEQHYDNEIVKYVWQPFRC